MEEKKDDLQFRDIRRYWHNGTKYWLSTDIQCLYVLTIESSPQKRQIILWITRIIALCSVVTARCDWHYQRDPVSGTFHFWRTSTSDEHLYSKMAHPHNPRTIEVNCRHVVTENTPILDSLNHHENFLVSNIIYWESLNLNKNVWC